MCSSVSSNWSTPSLVQSSCRREAARDAAAEPMLSSFLHACILSHSSFEDALAFVLSKRLASPCFLVSSCGGLCSRQEVTDMPSAA